MRIKNGTNGEPLNFCGKDTKGLPDLLPAKDFSPL
jgi:hypothetical protein